MCQSYSKPKVGRFLRHSVDARNVVLTVVDSDFLSRRCTVSSRSAILALAKLLFHVPVRPLKQIHVQLAAYRPSCKNGFRQNESRFRSGRTVAFLFDGISSDGISLRLVQALACQLVCRAAASANGNYYR